MSAPSQALSPEFAVAYREMMLQGLAGEMQTTKKVIAAIPDAKRDYRHDPKSRTAWELAWHLASVDVQFLEEIAEGVFKMDPRYKDQEPKTVAEMVAWYDKNFTRAAEKVRAMTPEQLVKSVNFYGMFDYPAVVYLSFLNNHSVHHRGELATYLRPMGSKVPSIYGPSADEEVQAA
ncbi:MAG TPA: DinB family protein [Terriglobales bacterium]|nr:DinB family protein [Terriglobales bacterium]